MPEFVEHQTDVLNLGSQGAGGDAEVMVNAALNNTYRRINRIGSNEMRKREFVVNFSAPTQATVTGTGTETFDVTASTDDAVTVKIDEGISQAVVLDAGTAQTAAQVVANLNDDTKLLSAEVTGTSVKLTSSSYGRRSVIEIVAVSNDAYTLLGFSAGTTLGTNDYQYALPLYARTELFFESQNNDGPVEVVTSNEGSRVLRPTIQTGSPLTYWRVGQYGVALQPSTRARAVNFVSSSASDATTTYVTITGYLNGIMVREKNATNGTTAVTTTQTFDSIERVVKTADDGVSWVGAVTLKDVSSNILAEIPTWVTSPSYQWIQFDPIPDEDISYILTAQAYKPDLVNDEDWPEFDDQFHDLLTMGAAAEVLGVFGKPEMGRTYAGMYKERFGEYRSYVDPSPNLIQTAADVQSSAGGQAPRPPWIAGVHRGIAKGA